MSLAAAGAPRQTLRLVAVTTLVAAAGGAAIGMALAADPPENSPHAPDPGPRIGLRSGVARLPLPEGWQPLRRRSTLPGLEAATAVRGVHSEVALDLRPPERASLLPAAVEAADAGALPQPQPRNEAPGATWRYELPGTGSSSSIVAFVLPTTGGVVTIACQARVEAIDRAGDECEQAIGAVQLDGATSLPPAPETAARIALPKAMERLNRQRRSGRRALSATQSPQGRSAAALSLAHAYAAAAEQLRPLAAGATLRVTATLVALAHQHRTLAVASRHRNSRAARRAGARIVRAERRLASLLAALTGPQAGSS